MVDFKFINFRTLNMRFTLLFLIMFCSNALAQYPGFNYQAMILTNQNIEIPGTDVSKSNVPLSLENIVVRFTISNEETDEYIEKHSTTTDEFGMISLIVGDGQPFYDYSFNNIIWDGKPRYLKVEFDIEKDNDGFFELDNQKILYIPQVSSNSNSGNGYGNIKIVNNLQDLIPPHNEGDLVWITSYGDSNDSTLLIFDSNNWVPVNEDFDSHNELDLIVVENNINRDAIILEPKTGNKVWNIECKCIQVYNDTEWVSITTNVSNGIITENNTIKLGGKLTEATTLTTEGKNTLAIKGLNLSENENDNVLMLDPNTGVLKQKPFSEFSNFNQLKRTEIIIYAKEGQLKFQTPLDITSKDRINVYRNGINIGFEIVNNTTIQLEPEAICYSEDQIRIVQMY